MRERTECCRMRIMRRWRYDTLNWTLRKAVIRMGVRLRLRVLGALWLGADFLHVFFVFLPQQLAQIRDVASASRLHDEGLVISFQAHHASSISQSLAWDRENRKDILCAQKRVDTTNALRLQEFCFARPRHDPDQFVKHVVAKSERIDR